MSAVSRIAPTTTIAITITATPSMRPMRSTSRCSGVTLLGGTAEQPGDVPHLGRHPGRGHDGPAAPPDDRRAAEDHVEPVADPDRLGDRRDVLQHRLALPGQRRLGDGQRRPPRPAARRRRPRPPRRAARTSPGTTSAAAYPLLAPVADDPCRRRRHPLQRRDRLLGAGLLHVAEDRVGDDDRRDHDRVERRRLAALQHPRHQRDHDRGQQQVDQRVGELAEELAPRRHTLRRLEPVRPRIARAAPPPPPRSSRYARPCRAPRRPRPRRDARPRGRSIEGCPGPGGCRRSCSRRFPSVAHRVSARIRGDPHASCGTGSANPRAAAQGAVAGVRRIP